MPSELGCTVCVKLVSRCAVRAAGASSLYAARRACIVCTRVDGGCSVQRRDGDVFGARIVLVVVEVAILVRLIADSIGRLCEFGNVVVVAGLKYR